MQVELTVPNSWEGITLKKYLEYLKDAEDYKDDPEALTAVTLMHFCGLKPEWMGGISVNDLNLLKSKINNFIEDQEHELKRKIMIDGIPYGFEPNLSEMTYGAYLDITKWDTFTINDNWPKIMNILYRPIVSELNGKYIIKPYDGKDNHKLFLNVTMDVHFGALFFFINLSMDLLSDTLSFMTEMDITPNMKQILEKNGDLIQLLLHSRTTTLQNLIKL